MGHSVIDIVVELVHPPHSRDPPLRLARAKRGFTCLWVVEECAPDARRRSQHMFPPVGHARWRWRVSLTSHVRGTDMCTYYGSYYRVLSIRGFNYTYSHYSQRVPTPFRETGVSSQETDFPVHIAILRNT